MALTKKETAILQELGNRYMECATLPIQREKMELWKSLNRFQMQRPMVVIDQLPIHELLLDGEMICQVADPFWRKIEFDLRFSLYRWRHFPVDMVLEPFITIPKAITMSDYGIKIKEEAAVYDPNNSVVGHHYRNQIATLDDVAKIKDLKLTHDAALSQNRLEEARVLFDEIAPVRLGGGISFHLGVWDKLAMYMGVEDIYYMLIDAPEVLHAAMRRITDATIAGIKQANALKIVDDRTNTCHCSYIYSDLLLPDFGESKGATSENCWAYGLAQLFTSVSPAVTEEFEFPYITEMAKYFGKIYYGCCDRLDDRLDLIKRIPNVQKVSCSPWSNRQAFAEKIGGNLIMSNKPTPAFLAADPFDEAVIRRDLIETVKAARAYNANLELILKDISTVNYQPERLTRWAEIAMEVVSSY